MPRSSPSLLAVVLVASASTAGADSYAPFTNFRVADATGRYYLVVKQNGGEGDPGRGTPVTFEIAERRPGSPPVAPAHDELKDFRTIVTNPEVKVREGVIRLGKGNLDRCPSELLISSTGQGFVGLDVRGYNYGSLRSGDAVVVVARDGTVRHRKDLIDLFQKSEVDRFSRSAGGVWWCGGGWIDERRKEVVVVGEGSGQNDQRIPRLFRIVDLDSGKVREGSPEVVLAALAESNPGALVEATDLAAELKLDRAKADLVRLFSDEATPDLARLHVAVALAALGDRRGGDAMRRAALREPKPSFYAITNLPAVLGDDAAPVLCEVVRRFGDKRTLGPWQAMHEVSARAAVPPLLELLREGKPGCVDFAVDCLGDKGPEAKTAVPNLIKLLDREDKPDRLLSTHQHVAIALGKIGPVAEAALPSLIRLAEKHAPGEWNRVKAQTPAPENDHFGGMKYSDDYLIDTICKIRKK